MPFELVIDGYNLLHAAGLARPKYGPGDLERRRIRLLQRLAKLLDTAVQQRTTVVFDAHRSPPRNPIAQPPQPMQVIFAPAPLEADDLIEEILARHSSPKQVLVVSSDHRLQRAARRRGASSLDSDQFLDQLDDGPTSSRDSARPGRTHSTAGPAAQALDDRLAAAAQRELEQQSGAPRENCVTPTNRGAERTGGIPALDPLDDPSFWERRIGGET